VDFRPKFRGFADLENTVDRGSAVYFGADSRLCLSWCSILGPKRDLDHRSFFSLGRYVNEFIPIISFFRKSLFNSGVRLLFELYCVIKHVTFFTVCAKLLVAMAFTFTFRIWTTENIGGSTDLATKGHGSAELHAPIHPDHVTSLISVMGYLFWRAYD